ncbi:MAG: hypothetical protein KDA68_05335 [Planctomycetaceae bacterium]|nr:hypothetical protein [Planctomycetaceae bacterium]
MRKTLTNSLLCCLITTAISLCSYRSTLGAEIDSIALKAREEEPVAGWTHIGPPIFREIVRQAVFMTAHDYCGLQVRDELLHESLPDPSDPATPTLELGIYYQGPDKHPELGYSLNLITANAPEKLWEIKLKGKYEELISDLTREAEKFSREDFKVLFEKRGWTRPIPPNRPQAESPENFEQLVFEFNELGIASALRQNESEIREKGASPELLANMAVGYANLSASTSWLFGEAHRIYAARALLYAERLIHDLPESPWALWHRAYVRALIGAHLAAEADIKLAREIQSKKSDPRDLPFWTEMIEQFCQGKIYTLDENRKSGKELQLALYLKVLGLKYGDLNDLTNASADRLLKDVPDCMSVWDAICGLEEVGATQVANSKLFTIQANSLRKRIPMIPGLPDEIVDAIRKSARTRTFTEETDFRLQIIDDLREKSLEKADRLQPSLTSIGNLIDEINFRHVIRRLEFEWKILNVPTERTIHLMAPLVRKHRYGSFINYFSSSPDDVTRGIDTAIANLSTCEMGFVEFPMFYWIQKVEPDKSKALHFACYRHTDPTYSQIMLGIKCGVVGSIQESEKNQPKIRSFWTVTNKMPPMIATQIYRNWKDAEPLAAEGQKIYADDPIVMTALMYRYNLIGKYQDARYCAEQVIRITPNHAAYRILANSYLKTGNDELWKQTLERALKLPDIGLETASIECEIAKYHMKRKEFDQALPYAESAAGTYSGSALETAARCHELMHHWKESEAYFRAVAERYPTQSMQWLMWSVRTGKGDKAAAKKHAQAYFGQLGLSPNLKQLLGIGTFYLLDNDPKKALAAYEKAYMIDSDLYEAYQIALIADELGDVSKRDEFLKKVIEFGKDSPPTEREGVYAEVARLMQKTIESGNLADFDLKRIDDIIQMAGENVLPTNIHYFIAAFLKNRGDLASCRKYLELIASSDDYSWQNHTLACHMRRELFGELSR